jgi:hypothetical protein
MGVAQSYPRFNRSKPSELGLGVELGLQLAQALAELELVPVNPGTRPRGSIFRRNDAVAKEADVFRMRTNQESGAAPD